MANDTRVIFVVNGVEVIASYTEGEKLRDAVTRVLSQSRQTSTKYEDWALKSSTGVELDPNTLVQPGERYFLSPLKPEYASSTSVLVPNYDQQQQQNQTTQQSQPQHDPNVPHS
jgi:hypothetical protein